ncbi:MAG: hypothetical protein V3U80_03435 [Flavobacteriaceae bacterium]
MIINSCEQKSTLSAKQIRTGTFISTLDNSDLTTKFIRNDSIQIDFFKSTIDSSYITWNSDFEYVLKNLNPKTKNDQFEFIVRITGIYADYYTYKGHFKGSKFNYSGKATLQQPNTN